MKSDRIKGKCWHEGCSKKYTAQARVVVLTKLKNKCDLEIRACKEHFLMAWDEDFKMIIDNYKSWKE